MIGFLVQKEKAGLKGNLFFLSDVLNNYKQMCSLIERQSNSIRPFIESINAVNELSNRPVRLLLDSENLYIATIE